MDDCSTFSVAHTGGRAAFVLKAGDRSYCSIDLGPPPLWTVAAGALRPALAFMEGYRPKNPGATAWVFQGDFNGKRFPASRLSVAQRSRGPR
jgi:hypothetical protein